ncbi:MAG: preprotein translocase subunit SecE [Atopobiaceae bacterium]|nr:preprotein translocase subunit SecE [Atopobiaceae bacterium]
MAKRERNKRSARKARQKERARIEEAHAVSGVNKETEKRSLFKGKSNNSGKVKVAAKEDRKGLAKVTGYFGDVRTEMRHVTWPTPAELRSYSVAVIAFLILFGVAIWLVDTGFVAGLVQYTNLRG